MRFMPLCCLTIAIMTTAAALRLDAAEPVIAIDVGHSKSSPGATSARGIPEFLFNRTLATELFERLSSDGIHAFLIGEDGQLTDLRKRIEQARAGKATFFLSMHHDSVQPRYLRDWKWKGAFHRYSDRFSGYALFVSRKNQDLASSLRCASDIGAALRKQGLRPSPHHAEAIPGESREWANEANGVYYCDRLSVLRNAACPAVLLEAGIIVNREEEEKLQTVEMRRAIAAAVEQGLKACGMVR